MRNVFTLRIAMLVAILLTIASCSNLSKESYITLIPKDAVQVVSLDLQSISDKAALTDPENDKYKKQMMDMVASSGSDQTSNLLKSLIEDPAVSGIDLREPIYMFLPGGEMVTPAVVAKMNNMESFDALIETVVAEKVLKDVVHTDLFNYAETGDGSLAILYNTDIILVVNNTQNPRDYPAIRVGSELYEQSLIENVYDNGGFMQMLDQKGDIKFLTSFASLPEDFADQLKLANKINANTFDVEKMMIVGSTSFDKGEVNVYMSYYTEDPANKALIEENLAIAKTMNGNLLKKLPESSLLVIATSVDGEAVCEQFEKQIENNPEMSKYMGRDKEMVENVKNLLKTVEGDVVFAPAEFNSMSDFTLLMYAELNSDGEKMLKEVLAAVRGVKELEENRYVYATGFVDLYFGVKDGLFYFTNKKDYAIGENQEPSFATAYPNAAGKSMFVGANCGDIVAVCTKMRLIRSVPRDYREMLNEIKTLELSSTDKGLINFRIVLNNDSENSLKYMLGYIKNMVD